MTGAPVHNVEPPRPLSQEERCARLMRHSMRMCTEHRMPDNRYRAPIRSYRSDTSPARQAS
jgi:hypothetical protein